MPDELAGGEHSEGKSIEEVSGGDPTNHRPQPPSCASLQVLRHIFQLWDVVFSKYMQTQHYKPDSKMTLEWYIQIAIVFLEHSPFHMSAYIQGKERGLVDNVTFYEETMHLKQR